MCVCLLVLAFELSDLVACSLALLVLCAVPVFEAHSTYQVNPQVLLDRQERCGSGESAYLLRAASAADTAALHMAKR